MKIACDKCGGIIAHIIGKSMVESVRQGHKMSVTGKDYVAILSCPNTGKCDNKVAITCEDSKILLENLTIKEDSNEPTETKDPNDGGTKVTDEGKDGEVKGGEKVEGTDPEPEPTPEPAPDNTPKPDGSGSDNGGSEPEPKKDGEGQDEPVKGNDDDLGNPPAQDPVPTDGGDGTQPKERKYTRL